MALGFNTMEEILDNIFAAEQDGFFYVGGKKLTHDEFYRMVLAQCYRLAQSSPDTSTQLGAILLTPHGTVLGATASVNTFPPDWVPTPEDFERPRKYLIGEHAERGAIYKAARKGFSTDGLTMVCTWAACADCARAIVCSGIKKLVRHHPPQDEAVARWMESVAIGDEIMKTGGVEIIDIHGPIQDAFPILRGGEIYDPRI